MKRAGKCNRISEQFSTHRIAMLKSPAWCALSLSARRILDRLEIELGQHGLITTLQEIGCLGSAWKK
jgi:hypothetical protein